MRRINLYESVHKGLRAELFDVHGAVSRADFAVEAEAQTVVLRVRGAIKFLEEHSLHEDTHVMPLLAQADAGVFAQLSREHREIDASLHELCELLSQLDVGTSAQRVQLGRILHSRLTRAIAMQLVHMEREENEANRALWTRFDDEQLEEAHGDILAAIAPPRLAQWIELMLPAMNEPERAELVANLHAKVPAGAFDTLTGPARRRLGRDAWARIAARALNSTESAEFAANERIEARS